MPVEHDLNPFLQSEVFFGLRCVTIVILARALFGAALAQELRH